MATPASGAIVSSMASVTVGISYIDAADGTGINPMPNTIELRYAGDGDANLDGTTNLADFLTLVRNFGKSVPFVPAASPTLAQSPPALPDPRLRLTARRTLAQTIIG